MDNLRELGGPAGGFAAIVVGLAHNGGALLASSVDWVFATVDLWLPLASTVANVVAPRVAFVDEGVANQVLLAVATVFLLVLVTRIYRRSIQ